MPKLKEIDIGNFGILPFLTPVLPEQLIAGKVKSEIRKRLGPMYALVESHKMRDIQFGIPDQFRIRNGYYEVERVRQEYEDEWFARLLPVTFKRISEQLEPIDKRWEKTVAYARLVQQLLFPDQDDLVVECRAKSTFGIWTKTDKRRLSLDQVYDLYGVRVYAESNIEAYEMRRNLCSYFGLDTNHPYYPYIPLRGSLFNEGIGPVPNLLRMNIRGTGKEIFEVQITTIDDFNRTHNDFRVAGEKYEYHLL